MITLKLIGARVFKKKRSELQCLKQKSSIQKKTVSDTSYISSTHRVAQEPATFNNVVKPPLISLLPPSAYSAP